MSFSFLDTKEGISVTNNQSSTALWVHSKITFFIKTVTLFHMKKFNFFMWNSWSGETVLWLFWTKQLRETPAVPT